MRKYKIGIVGFGKIAQDQHLPAIRANDRFELLALSSQRGLTHPEADRFYTTPEEMLAGSPELDAIAICTPPGPRRAIAALCLTAGKHVLLEKPPAGTLSEVEDIRRRGEAAGKVVYATWHARHASQVETARTALAGQTVTKLKVDWKEDVRRWHPGQDWVFEPGGFGVFDPGINACSILTHILPDPIFVTDAELLIPAGRAGPIAANVTFGSAHDGADLKMELDWRQTGPQTWAIAVETAQGLKLTLSEGGSRLEIEGREPTAAPDAEYPEIYREFAELLDAERSNLDVAPMTLVSDAFLLSRRTEVEAFTF